MNSNTTIDVSMQGLLAPLSREIIDQYFSFKKATWIPRHKRIKYIPNRMGIIWPDSDTIGIGLGAILFLKQNNPEFASRLNIISFPNLKEFKPLDLNYLTDIKVDKWREFQLEIIKACSTKMIGNIVSGMATGKSLCLLAICYLASKQNQNVLFTSPTLRTRKNFLDKAKDLGMYNVVPYEEVRGTVLPSGGYIIVANSQVVNSDIEEYITTDSIVSLIYSVKSLITDEAQDWTKESWNLLLVNLPKLHRLFGFSATSVSEKNEKAESFLDIKEWHTVYALNACGPVIYRTSREQNNEHTDIPDLIEILFIWDELKHIKLLQVKDWSSLLPAMYENDARTDKIIDLIKLLQKYKRVTVIPINGKDQAIKILKRVGDKAICWFGNDVIFDVHDNKLNPSSIEELFEKGCYDTIIATSHIDVGWDLPILNCTILQEGKDSEASVQKSGRVIRKSNVKPLIINFQDNFYVYSTQADKRAKAIEQYYKSKFSRFSSLDRLEAYLQVNSSC
jgi:superfamily II DNA or RNA helicase